MEFSAGGQLLLWETNLLGISLGCINPHLSILVKMTNGRYDLLNEMLNLIRAQHYKIEFYS